MTDGITIKNKYAFTHDLTKQAVCDDSFNEISISRTSPFSDDPNTTANFTIQIRTISTTSLTGKSIKRMHSVINISIDELKSMLKYAESELLLEKLNRSKE